MDLKYYKSHYCSDIENVENYEYAKKDNFKGWDVHHRKEAEFSRKELIALGMYYNVSSEELIFLTRAEHNKLHKKDKHHTEESKKKISKAKKGNTNTKGTHWYNNGKINIMAKECPDGFTPGHSRK